MVPLRYVGLPHFREGSTRVRTKILGRVGGGQEGVVKEDQKTAPDKHAVAGEETGGGGWLSKSCSSFARRVGQGSRQGKPLCGNK